METKITAGVLPTPNHLDAFVRQIKIKSDKLINYFLASYFLVGLILAPFYDTWIIAIGVGALSLVAYYLTKHFLHDSNLYQYILSAVLGIFMAQYIFQMHGMFEMHFTAFIGSAILVTYQNWKLQLPMLIVVVVHHALFGYLQFLGFGKIYFTQLEYMDLQTFIIHISLAAVIFFLCGLWAYHFKKYSELFIEQNFEMGKLEESEAKKEELQKTNTELDRFVYSVSHDLRAPLTSVLGILHILEADNPTPSQKKHFGMINTSINRLDSFIQQILHYSRNSRMEVSPEEINFEEMIKEKCANLKFMNGAERLKVKGEVDNAFSFHSDKMRIGIIFNNLISNAIKYQDFSKQESFISIKIKNLETQSLIEFSDNGIGIQEEHADKIFEMFFRVSHKQAGSGLGLYIVKETVNKLNGTISVNSEPAFGTTFTIVLPNIKK